MWLQKTARVQSGPVPHCGVHKGCILSTIIELQLFFSTSGFVLHGSSGATKGVGLNFPPALFLATAFAAIAAAIVPFCLLFYSFVFSFYTSCHCVFGSFRVIFVIFPFIFNPPSCLFVFYLIIFLFYLLFCLKRHCELANVHQATNFHLSWLFGLKVYQTIDPVALCSKSLLVFCMLSLKLVKRKISDTGHSLRYEI